LNRNIDAVANPVNAHDPSGHDRARLDH
jgi:hypothetical protein